MIIQHLCMVYFILSYSFFSMAMEASLHILARRNKVMEVNNMLLAGADCNIPDEEGFTPLQLAAMNGHQKVVAILLAYEADTQARTPAGKTAYELADANGHDTVAAMLKQLYIDAVRQPQQAPCGVKDNTERKQMSAVKVSSPKKGILIKTVKGKLSPSKPASDELFGAIEKEDITLVRKLIESGVDCRERNQNGGTPLHIAATKGNVEIGNMLIAASVNVNAVNHFGNTALHVAALLNNIEFAQFLIGHSADRSLCNKSGHTAWHIATNKGHRGIVQLLQGLTVTQQTAKPKAPATAPGGILGKGIPRAPANPLMSNIPHAPPNPFKSSIPQAPLNPVADRIPSAPDNLHADFTAPKPMKVESVTQKVDDGSSPLHKAVEAGNKKLVKQLLYEGAGIQSQDKEGLTPLHVAARSGNKGIVTTLLDHGADIFAQDSYGCYPIHYAALKVHRHILQLFIDRGSAHIQPGETLDVFMNRLRLDNCFLNLWEKLTGVVRERPPAKKSANIQEYDYRGFYLIHQAAHVGDLHLAQSFLESGGDVNVSVYMKEYGYNSGQTALQLAAAYGHIEMVELLLKHKADVNIRPKKYEANTALNAAVCSGHKVIVELLIAHKAIVTGIDLLSAVEKEYEEIAKVLLAAKADPYKKNGYGLNCLHIAAKNGFLGIVRILVEQYKVNIESLTSRGESSQSIEVLGKTPLHLAVEMGHTDIVRYLLENKAKIEAADGEQQTALHIAAYKDHIEVVRVLLAKGANKKAKNARGEIPFNLARYQGAVAKLLK